MLRGRDGLSSSLDFGSVLIPGIGRFRADTLLLLSVPNDYSMWCVHGERVISQ